MDREWNGWRVVLASASPRRRELLARIGIEAEVIPSLREEKTEALCPQEIVEELSRHKAEDVASRCPGGTLVIGADTVVACKGEVLGKPGSEMKARQMIEKLQGNVHQVYTGVTLILCQEDGTFHGSSFVEGTDVWVYPMDQEEIRAYAFCGEPLDKAGGYGIQGYFSRYIQKIEGNYDNVVGLPLGRLCQEIKLLMEAETDD